MEKNYFVIFRETLFLFLGIFAKSFFFYMTPLGCHRHTHIQFFKIRFLLQTLKMFDCIWHYTFLTILGHLILDTEAYGSGVPVSTYFTVCSEMTPRHSTTYNPSSASPNPTPYYSSMDSTPVFEISVNQSCFKAGDVLQGTSITL